MILGLIIEGNNDFRVRFYVIHQRMQLLLTLNDKVVKKFCRS